MEHFIEHGAPVPQSYLLELKLGYTPTATGNPAAPQSYLLELKLRLFG